MFLHELPDSIRQKACGVDLPINGKSRRYPVQALDYECIRIAAETLAIARPLQIAARGVSRWIQWFCEPRCAQPVVCFSTMLNSSYIAIAIAPTTSKPAKARPICMAEPAEISR
jgi:hypothetical protein